MLKAPEAELRDDKGTVIGRHFAGPSWKHNDGSEIKGRAVARVDAPDADSIPWLLVTVTDRSGSGVLSRVTSIQRVNTVGGKSPKEDGLVVGQVARVPYTADYFFYRHVNVND